MNFRNAVLGLAAVTATVVSGAALAQAYPSKPVRFIIGFAAGSSIEAMTRIVTDDINKRTGAIFVIEQRPGALGIIGMEAVAKAAPDGYTLMPSSSATHSSGPQLTKLPTPDPVKDFTHLAALDTFSVMLVVNASSGIKTPAQLIEAAKRGKLNYGYGSATGQVTASAFSRAAGIGDLVVGVPYKSQPLAVTDLLGGHVHFAASDIPSVAPHIRSGRLNVLGVSGDKRSSLFPDVPTWSEQGVKAELSGWVGVAGPAGLSEEVRNWWVRNVTATLNNSVVTDQLKTMGVEPLQMFGPALTKYVADQYQTWGRHIREAGIKPE